MTAVDFCSQATPAAPTQSKTSDFTCTACNELFGTAVEHRAHFKSERHVYNSKRKLAGLRPISHEAWERKIRESKRGADEQKGTSHLKAKKDKKLSSDAGSEGNVPGAFGPGERKVKDVVPEGEDAEPDAPLTPRNCIFDRKHFESVEMNLAYMEKTYSFFIPDVEYCNSVPELLGHLLEKVSTEPHSCINCNRRFPDLQSVRRHMLDKGHTQLASEVHTRRGKYDEDGTNELQEELEPFFDFNSSMREVAEKMPKQQQVASILRYFDADKDKKLNAVEVASLWEAANDGAKLSEAQYEGACSMSGADPKEGVDVEALVKLYASGFADLDVHFKMLQELLMKSRKKLKTVLEEDGEDAQDEDEDGDEDGEGDESEEGDGDDEVVECEDEDEFEEVMRVLGLKPVTITPTGDLMLPNGSIAVHRDVSYIYRQRGERPDAIQLARGKRPQVRAQLMLSNAANSGSYKLAMTTRQTAREGKRIIAVLRTRSIYDMKMGMISNHVGRSRPNIRTGRGDNSNGR